MGRNHRFDDRDIERLLSGKAPHDPSCRDLTEALLKLRAAYRQPASEETARAHVAAMVEEAQSLAATGELSASAARPAAGARPSFRRKVMGNRFGRILVRLSAAALGLSLISGGLVLAGADLPGLPGQARDDALDRAQQALDEAGTQGNAGAAQTPAFLAMLLDYINDPGGDEGCVFGQTVAGIASDGKVAADDPCEKAGAAEAQGSKATGEAASEQGRQTAEDAKSNGAAASEQGRQTASDAQSTGAEKSSQGKQTASDAQSSGQGGQGSPQGGKQTGDDKSQSGQSTAGEKSGGQSSGGGRP